MVYNLVKEDAGWSRSVARRAHNPEVAGSSPAPATKRRKENRKLNRRGGEPPPWGSPPDPPQNLASSPPFPTLPHAPSAAQRQKSGISILTALPCAPSLTTNKGALNYRYHGGVKE